MLEKSPGLFLSAARELLQLCPFARFVVIGDGPLLESLRDLAGRLDILNFVTFTGWVGGSVPLALRGLDAIVNPSLRGWSETFCVANIEAMSMEVPLVTFAVGGSVYVYWLTIVVLPLLIITVAGVGEYVRGPHAAGASGIATDTTDFTVTPNAVVVNTATPVAIARAVHHLVSHPQLRAELGRAGRRTVTERFHLSRQMEQYSDLYSNLHHQRLELEVRPLR